MKILVITGSPHKHGTSNFLVEYFIKGAIAANNEVFCFDSAFNDVNACIGCNTCRKNGNCIWDDSFNQLKEKLLLADVVVFSTPIYYMNMTSQLKTVIDRFYQLEFKEKFKGKKYVVLATAWDKKASVFDTLIQNFNLIAKFLKWEKLGQLLVNGVDSLSDIEPLDFSVKAYELGYKIREDLNNESK